MVFHNDAWHHQLLHGVDPVLGKVYCCNPCETMDPNILLVLTCTDPWMRIPASHVTTRFDTDEQRWRSLQEDAHFTRYKVYEQVLQLQSSKQQQEFTSSPSPHGGSRIAIHEAFAKGEKEVLIPWGGLPGVTLFAKAGSEADKELRDYAAGGVQRSRLIPLPAYKSSSNVLFFDRSYFIDKLM